MKVFDTDGTINLFSSKGEEYSDISDDAFAAFSDDDSLYSIAEVDFPVVANWVCNTKELQVVYDVTTISTGESVDGYPITKTAHRGQIPDLDNPEIDEYPGISSRVFDNPSNIYTTESRYWHPWYQDEPAGNPYYIHDVFSLWVNFFYHRDKWYVKTLKQYDGDSDCTVTGDLITLILTRSIDMTTIEISITDTYYQ